MIARQKWPGSSFLFAGKIISLVSLVIFISYCRYSREKDNNAISPSHIVCDNQIETFHDVIIAVDGASLKCHKIVLAASSSYFHRLLLENERTSKHPVVFLEVYKTNV